MNTTPNRELESRHESESRESSPVRSGRPNARTSCDLCKRMKIKCERKGDTCLHCIDRGATCETTLVERKKRQVKRIDPGSIVEMEDRIRRLEAVLLASGLDSQLNGESPSEVNETPSPDTANVTDRLSTLLIDEEGTSSFLGSSSGFSLFSPQGLSWISKKTGSPELPQFIRSITKSFKMAERISNVSKADWKTDLWTPMPRSSHEPLPPKNLADKWIECYFRTFNTMLPLYDRELFDQYYAQQYTAKPPSAVAWYATFNVVLAMGGMISEIHSQTDGRESTEPFPFLPDSAYAKYFRNAASCFLDLTFREPSLLAVQAMCGMGFLQQMSLEPLPSYVLTAAAGRMAYSIGLHQKLDASDLTETEINQRRNVFWITYIMDKVLALRLGHPSVMNDNDVGVDLPQENKSFSCFPDGSQRYDIFRCQTQLAMLESRIYTELYSADARKRSALERLRSVGQIDKALQEWRLTVPIEIRPDEQIQCSKEQYPPVFLMHFEFFNCVTTIHRVSIHHRGSWTYDDVAEMTTALHSPQINPRVYSSQSICMAAARSTMGLLQNLKISEISRFDQFIWTQMYYPLSAFLLLFANALHNPEDPSTASDIQLMDLCIAVLSPASASTGSFNARASLQLFQKLRNVTKKFFESNYRAQPTKTKRVYGSDLPKEADSPSYTTVAPQPVTSPQYQTQPGQNFMNYAAQPYHAHLEQYAQPSFDAFGNGSFMPESQPSMPIDDLSFPTLGFDAFMFSENFEWDLANLWDQEPSPASHIE